MRNLIFILGTLFIVSCSEIAVVNSPDEYITEAFESDEYQALQAKYDEYVEIEFSITKVFEPSITAKLSESDLEARKEAYVQELTQKMFEVKKNKDLFLLKYPRVAEQFNAEQLINVLRKTNQ